MKILQAINDIHELINLIKKPKLFDYKGVVVDSSFFYQFPLRDLLKDIEYEHINLLIKRTSYFKGDIIITDPCYIDNNYEIWNHKKVDIISGTGLENLGFTKYLWSSTLIGDWSCSTFKIKDSSLDIPLNKLTDNDVEVIGNFCADSGSVGVFLLKEVHKFNPNFDWYEKRPHTTTLIKDFDGDVSLQLDGDNLIVVGDGNIKFVGRQRL